MRNRFNGAVLHQHGRQWGESPPPSQTTLLQWGRASSARKTSRRTNSRAPTCCCFNGAVLHQHGRPLVGGEASQVSDDASMGPCFISTEDVLYLRMSRDSQEVQWGRASSARKTRSHHKGGSGGVSLQWGRASSARKTITTGVPAHLREMLQWGRASSARKTPDHWIRVVTAGGLQWGRASSARKTVAVCWLW